MKRILHGLLFLLHFYIVIPAKAGIQWFWFCLKSTPWIPAYAGMTISILVSTGLINARPLPSNPEQNKSSARTQPSDWIKEAVIYKVYLRAFSTEGKLTQLESQLPELQKLGVTCIELLPFQPTQQTEDSSQLSHPYHVADYWGVDLEYGTKDGFSRLVQEAHFNNLKVIVDWVLNIEALNHGLAKNGIQPFTKVSNPSTAAVRMDLNQEEMQKFVAAIHSFWVREFDIDGFNIVNASQIPDSLLRRLRFELKGIKPSFVIAGRELNPYQEKYFDLVYSSGLYNTMLQVVQEHQPAAQIEQVLDKENQLHSDQPLTLRWIEDFDTPRAVELFGPSHQAAAVLTLTTGGVPMLYNGQEIGEKHQPSLTQRQPIDWHFGLKNNTKLKKFYKLFLKVRAEHPAFSRGQTFPLKIYGSKDVLSFARSYRGDAALVAVNFSSEYFQGTMELPEIFRSEKGKIKIKNVFPGEPLQVVNDSEVMMNLPPWGYQVWVMK